MHPRRWILAACVASSLLTGCGAGDPERPKPNIVWICIDVLRADRLGCYGYDKSTSPHIDELARRGVVFDRAFSQSSWTKPSVPSYFTSLYPSQHQVLRGSSSDEEGRIISDVLHPEWTSMAEHFWDAGYATAAFVKNAQIRGFLGFQQGFQRYVDEAGSAKEINAKFRTWAGDVKDKPFFAYLHYLDVHWPFRPEPKWLEHFPAPAASHDFAGPGANMLQDAINDGDVKLAGDDVAHVRALYDACVRQADDAIGEIIAWLKANRLDENTIVVVMSDHGEELLEHGVVGHGRSLRDTVTRIPLVVYAPRTAGGRVTRGIVQSIDILPTIAELAGTASHEQFQGRSLAAWVTGRRPELADRPAISELLTGPIYSRSIRGARWKLVEHFASMVAPKKGTRRSGALDLDDGQRVSVRGAFRGDRFIADRFQPEAKGADHVELRAPITAIDGESRSLVLAGFTATLTEDASLKSKRTGEGVAFDRLRVGQVVQVYGALTGPRRLRATKARLRDDKSPTSRIKLEGTVTVTERSKPKVRLLGLDVRFDRDLELPGMSITAESGKRLLTPELLLEDKLQDSRLFRVTRTLYDLDRDPNEREDRATERSDVVDDLSRRLSTWSRALLREHVATHQELDEAMRQKLRSLGYLK